MVLFYLNFGNSIVRGSTIQSFSILSSSVCVSGDHTRLHSHSLCLGLTNAFDSQNVLQTEHHVSASNNEHSDRIMANIKIFSSVFKVNIYSPSCCSKTVRTSSLEHKLRFFNKTSDISVP